MTTKRISDLTLLTNLADTAVFPVDYNGTTYQVTGTALKTYVSNYIQNQPGLQFTSSFIGLSVTGDASITAGNLTVTGWINSANITANGNIIASSDITSGGNIVANGFGSFGSNISVLGNITSTGNLTISGNITANSVTAASIGTSTSTLQGSGSSITNINSNNINSGILLPMYGGTGVANPNSNSLQIVGGGYIINQAIQSGSNPTFNGLNFYGISSALSVPAASLNGSTLSANVSASSLVTVGNLANLQVAGTTIHYGNVIANSNVISTSTTTGAVVVTGGVGITGNVNIGSGLQVPAIGNVLPGTGTFTFAKATAIQASTIGNITPGAGTFTFVSASAIQASTIGNVAPGSATFTTLSTSGPATLANTVTGGLQAAAIGNATPGTGAFTTITTGSLQGIIGNTTPATGSFTTLNVTSTTNASGIGTGSFYTAGGAAIQQDLYVGGVVYANTISTVNRTVLNVVDPLLYLTSSQTYPYTYDIGFYSHFVGGSANTYQHTGLVRNYIDNIWYLVSNIPEPAGSYIDLTQANLVYDTIRVGGVMLANSTVSTSTSTGALTVAGGVGIAGNLYAGGLQATPIGNTVPSTAAFTTLTTSGLSTLANAVVGGLQAVAIGNATPGTGAFTTVVANGLQAANIGNVTPGIAAFTTVTTGSIQGIIGNVTPAAATHTTIVTNGLQAVAIGNTTPGTGAFTTMTTSAIQAANIGNVIPGYGAFTNLSSTGVVSGVGFTNYLASPPAIGGSAAAAGSFTNLNSSGTVAGSGFSTYLASPPAIGGTSPAAGSFTNLISSGTVSGTGFSTYFASPPILGGSQANAGSFTTLSASSTISGAGFSVYLASPPAIGGSAAAAGSFTTLSASSTVSGVGFTNYFASPPTIGGSVPGNATFANLTITGNTTMQQTQEVLTTKTGATGTVVHDTSTGLIFYHTGVAANFTANFTNMLVNANRTVVVTIVIVQGSTPYYPSGVQINGSAQTIKWISASTPTPTANRTEIYSFSLIQTTAGTWIVLGQMASYG